MIIEKGEIELSQLLLFKSLNRLVIFHFEISN